MEINDLYVRFVELLYLEQDFKSRDDLYRQLGISTLKYSRIKNHKNKVEAQDILTLFEQFPNLDANIMFKSGPTRAQLNEDVYPYFAKKSITLEDRILSIEHRLTILEAQKVKLTA